jgi:hypothetical protein
MRYRPAWSALLAALTLACAGARPPASAVTPVGPVPVDGFEDVSGWQAHPADGVKLAIGSDTGASGRAMRLDFKFTGGGYAVAHKAFDLDLPENYALSFRVRGRAPVNHLEFKLIDASGENVWWSVRRDVEFPETWHVFTIKKRKIQFAWGPAGGGEIRHVAAIEFAITAGSGGEGTVWIDELTLTPLPPPGTAPAEPAVSASSARPGQDPQAAHDGDPESFWASGGGDARPWLALDFQESREYGGLVLDWATGRQAADYTVEASDDGSAWRELRTVHGGNGRRDYLYLPESESRHLRVRALDDVGDYGAGLAEVAVMPLEWSASRAAFFEAVAKDAQRGSFPRGIGGEQVYWTVVGADGDAREGLLSEDGMLETGKGGFSIEPFLYLNGSIVTWADVQSVPSLEDGSLPIPSVAWSADDVELKITAFAVGDPGASSLIARYRILNQGARRVSGGLFLAIRPFQVNPPTQFLNMPGGFAPIREIAREGRVIRVNGEREVVCITDPWSFGAIPFDQGDVVTDYLRFGNVPQSAEASDPFEAASGALAYMLDLAPGAETEIDILVPLYPESLAPPKRSGPAGRAWVAEQFAQSRAAWVSTESRVTIEAPDIAKPAIESLRSQLGYILVNRAGPAIQPGTRSYARSWIRDGALTSSALLRLGHPEPVKEFIAWFAPHQYENGKVPCVVDWRGADPVPEHDSSGEFIFLVAEYWRYTRDTALLAEMMPRILKAAAYLDSLRHERRTPEYEALDKREFYGLLPPSISHEGYSAKPMHSYWDDFWALRGFQDAAYLAEVSGLAEDAARLGAIRAGFAADLAASIRAAMHRHGIDYVPGCADLGDFDATSTTIALSPAEARSVAPPGALESTFERYYTFFRDRANGASWDAFTPYEIRNLGAFVRLGWRDRAQELLAFFLSSQKPVGWRQWPEVVWRDERTPRFLGDLPHTWCGSDYVRSMLDMLAYVDESRDALVIAAGLPASWLAPDPGVVVKNLPTPYGRLAYTMAGDESEIRVRLEEGIRVPAGGIVVRAPLGGPAGTVLIDGRATAPESNGDVIVRALPAEVIIRR